MTSRIYTEQSQVNSNRNGNRRHGIKSKLIPWAFGLVLIALLAGCTPGSAISITGSGNVITREEDLTDFDRVATRSTRRIRPGCYCGAMDMAV